MKTLLLSFLLLGATAVHGQTAPAASILPDQAKTEQEVYSVHQSLAQAYVQGTDQQNIDVFYGENFRLGQNKDVPASRQQMDRKMKALVQEGLLSHRRLVQGESQLLVKDESTILVNGTWREKNKAGMTTSPENPVSFAFTYSRQHGVWKLTAARFLPAGKQSLAARNE
jgi:hypothetical protein